MTKREVGALAFTVMGVYALILAVNDVSFIFGSVINAVGSPIGISTVLIIVALTGPMLLRIAIGIILILYRDAFSGKLFPGGPDMIAVHASTKDVQAVAFSVVGILLIVQALPDIGAIAMNISYRAREVEPSTSVRHGMWIKGAMMVVKLVLGISLFFGGRSLSNYWHMLRNYGHTAQR